MKIRVLELLLLPCHKPSYPASWILIHIHVWWMKMSWWLFWPAHSDALSIVESYLLRGIHRIIHESNYGCCTPDRQCWTSRRRNQIEGWRPPKHWQVVLVTNGMSKVPTSWLQVVIAKHGMKFVSFKSCMNYTSSCIYKREDSCLQRVLSLSLIWSLATCSTEAANLTRCLAHSYDLAYSHNHNNSESIQASKYIPPCLWCLCLLKSTWVCLISH